jgi:Nucleotidyl transferase AbiEii toxin, Type IV TA system
MRVSGYWTQRLRFRHFRFSSSRTLNFCVVRHGMLISSLVVTTPRSASPVFLPSEIGCPTLLEFPRPRLLAYPKETVVAEKFEALVKPGIANTHMKNFYGLEVLSRTFAFEGKSLAQAIQNTFQKRGTDLPMEGMTVAFTCEFYDDVNKKRQWTAFCAKNKSYVEKAEFKAVMATSETFSLSRSAPSRKEIRSRRRGSPAALALKGFSMRFRIYDLRSTYATRLSAGGVADEWVTQLLRQGDVKVFKKYSQMKLQMKREALEQMNRQANEMPLDFGTATLQ